MKFYRKYFDEAERETIYEASARHMVAPEATNDEWEEMKKSMLEGAVFRTAGAEYWAEEDETENQAFERMLLGN